MEYGSIVPLVDNLVGARRIGYVGTEDTSYPLHVVRRGKGKKILLLAGVHGDEPAGVETLIDFFTKEVGRYEREFEFTAFPCVNPWGFDHSKRGNASGININRDFKVLRSEELRIISPLLEHYAIAIDLHETWSSWTNKVGDEPDGDFPDEFFLWETCVDPSKRVGAKIVENVRSAGFKVCQWPMIPTVNGDRSNNGVISYPEDQFTACFSEGNTSDEYLFAHHAPHTFTIETPRRENIYDRVQMNLITIKTILENSA